MEFHRDFRSVSQDTRRDKNSSAKWKYGSWALSGAHVGLVTSESVSGNQDHRAKVRPLGKHSDRSHWEARSKKPHPNIVKPRCNNNWMSDPSRVRDVVYAHEEIKDSIRHSGAELSASDSVHLAVNTDEITYSFDKTVSPNQPMTLDIFVKAGARETERLVQKEYEILDLSGEALKGRKARSDLRKPAGPSLAEMAREDDGFELV